MSKPMAVTMPFILLMLDVYPLGRMKDGVARVVLEKMPFLGLSIASGLLTLWAQRSAGAVAGLELHPLPVRLWVAVSSYVFYLKKMVWPADLAPFYPYPASIDVISAAYLGSLALLVLFTAASVFLMKKTKLFALAWFFYILTLLPVIGIVQVGAQSAADRYTYIPALSIFILAGIGAGRLFRAERLRKPVLAVCSFLTAVLIFLTVKQISVWKDSVSLWSYEIEVMGDVFTAYNNRAMAYQEQNRLDNALSDLTRAIELRPGNADIRVHRGLIYNTKGDYPKAIEDFEKAIELRPFSALVYNNRGIAYKALGRFDRALDDFYAAVNIEPGLAEAYHNMGLVYSELGDYEAALNAQMKAKELGYN